MSLRFCLLDADYVIEGRPVIRLFGVDECGRSVMVIDRNFRPYMYAIKNKKAEAALKKNKMVTGIEHTKKMLGIEHVNVMKIFVDTPPNVPEVRKAAKEFTDFYEYSINFYKRYMIDKGLYPLGWIEVTGTTRASSGFDIVVDAKRLKKVSGGVPKLKTLAFDIEVVDNKVIMISMAGYGFKKLITYKKAKHAIIVKNEKELIREFVKTVQHYDPDIIVGYNSDEFDFEVLRRRANEHKVRLDIGRDGKPVRFARRVRSSSARIMGRLHIDLFQYVNNLMSQQLQSEVLTLNEVAKELVGEGKEGLSFDDIINLWKKGNVSKLAEYCQHDSTLTLKLAENILVQVWELSKVCGQLPFDTSRSTFGLLSEWFLVRKSHEKNVIVPNNPHWDEIQQRRAHRFQGGYVREPIQGLHNNIAIFDFRSLYPSVIATFNISPETLGKSGHKVPEFEHVFVKKPKGFVSGVVEELIRQRQEVKKKLKKAKEKQELNEHQFALKILANATYGMFGNGGARWYCRECAESSAAFGRYYIKKSIKEAQKAGFVVLYGDTDSLFVTAKGDIKKQSTKFLEEINKTLPGILELELQGIYRKGLFVPQKLGTYTAKKRYALLDKEGNFLVRGMEAVRRDWCPIAKDLQRDVLRLVLEGKEKKAVQLVRETVKKVKQRKVDVKDISIKTMLGKPLSEYKAKGPHILVARKLEAAGHDVMPGTVISFVITKGKGSISDRAEPVNKVTVKDYDVDYYLNNQVVSVAMRVLQVLGYKERDLLSSSSLKRFVKK